MRSASTVFHISALRAFGFRAFLQSSWSLTPEDPPSDRALSRAKGMELRALSGGRPGGWAVGAHPWSAVIRFAPRVVPVGPWPGHCLSSLVAWRAESAGFPRVGFLAARGR